MSRTRTHEPPDDPRDGIRSGAPTSRSDARRSARLPFADPWPRARAPQEALAGESLQTLRVPVPLRRVRSAR